MALSFKINTYTVTTGLADDLSWAFATSELDTWIAAVNGNASNTNRQVTKVKDYTSSTGANYKGIVVKLAHPTLSDMHFAYRSNNYGAHLYTYAGDVYVDDGSNGGYGNLTNPIDGGTVNSAMTLTGLSETWVVYDTTDAKEFFHVGWRMASDNYICHLMLAKDSTGEWMSFGWYDSVSAAYTCAAGYTATGLIGPYLAMSGYFAASTSNYTGDVIPELYYNTNVGGVDRMNNKLLFKIASDYLGACDSAFPFSQYQTPDGTDWVSIGGYLMVETSTLP